MPYTPADRAKAWLERRTSPRLRASGEVRLQTPGGDWRGSLWDLSETGARIEIRNPPQPGVTALVSWESLDLFCRVIWAQDDACGVMFEKPISSVIVEQVRGATPTQTGPRADLGNIPFGKKRSRNFSASE